MTSQRSFAPNPDSVRAARLFLDEELPDLPQTTREHAELVVSELATNAVLHAATTFSVTVNRNDETLTIEVTDQASGQPDPQLMPAPANLLHGRGLLIVTRLATEWGITPNADGDGKTVWATLALKPDPDSNPSYLLQTSPA